jgi:hypothetical protein
VSSARIIDVTLAFAPFVVVPLALRLLGAEHRTTGRVVAAVLFGMAFIPSSTGWPAVLCRLLRPSHRWSLQ